MGLGERGDLGTQPTITQYATAAGHGNFTHPFQDQDPGKSVLVQGATAIQPKPDPRKTFGVRRPPLFPHPKGVQAYPLPILCPCRTDVT